MNEMYIYIVCLCGGGVYNRIYAMYILYNSYESFPTLMEVKIMFSC